MLTLSLLEFRNKMYANDPNYFRSQGIKDFPQNQCESEHTWSSSREPSMMCRSSGWHISILLLAHDLMVGGRRAQSPWTTGQGSFKPALTLRSRRPLDLKFTQTPCNCNKIRYPLIYQVTQATSWNIRDKFETVLEMFEVEIFSLASKQKIVQIFRTSVWTTSNKILDSNDFCWW